MAQEPEGTGNSKSMAARLGISFYENRTRCAAAAVTALANKTDRNGKEEKLYNDALNYLEYALCGKTEEWMEKG